MQITWALLALAAPGLAIAADLSGVDRDPLMILGMPDASEEQDFYKPIDLAISPDGFLYILDTGEDHVKKFDLHGNHVKTFGHSGKGPGEFEHATDLAFMNGALWLLDRGNGRVLVFENDRYARYFKPQKIETPMSLAVMDGRAYLCGVSLHPLYGGIEVYDQKGAYLKTLNARVDRHEEKGSTGALWNTLSMSSISDNRLLLGFKFDHFITILDAKGARLADKDMSGFYEAEKDRRGYPARYTAMAFSEGPGHTFLAAVCDPKDPVCPNVYQFNEKLTGLVGKRDMAATVFRIRYFPEYGMLAMITINNEVIFYRTT